MLISPFQSPDGPINLVTNDAPIPAPPILPLWVGVAVITMIVAAALIAWAIAARRAAVERDPAEYAFRALARRLRLPQRQAALLRRLADQVHCAPVALLLSNHALEAAALVHHRAKPTKRDLATLRQLQP